MVFFYPLNKDISSYKGLSIENPIVLKNRKNRIFSGFFNIELFYISRMLSKRFEILHVYEKRLQNSFDLKTGAKSSTCPEIYPNNWQKGVMSLFSKTVFVVTKIFRIWTMGVITFRTYILMSLVKFSWRLV